MIELRDSQICRATAAGLIRTSAIRRQIARALLGHAFWRTAPAARADLNEAHLHLCGLRSTQEKIVGLVGKLGLLHLPLKAFL
jgi:hypothetical protein